MRPSPPLPRGAPPRVRAHLARLFKAAQCAVAIVAIAVCAWTQTPLLPTASARRDGSPACGHVPGHGARETGHGPFSVTLSNTSYRPGTKSSVVVSLVASEQSTLRGFFVAAYDARGRRVGAFVVASPDSDTGADTDAAAVTAPGHARHSACDPPSSAVTHASNAEKELVHLEWMPPAWGVGNVTFRATVVPSVMSYYDVWASESLAQVVLPTVPEPPGAPTLVATSASAVTLEWEAAHNNGPRVDTYTLEARDESGALRGSAAVETLPAADDAAPATFNSDSTLRATLAGLPASLALNVRVSATNAQGTSMWSANSSVATVSEDSTVPPSPEAPEVRNITATSAHVTWDPAPTDASGLPILRYSVQALKASAEALDRRGEATRGDRAKQFLYNTMFEGPASVQAAGAVLEGLAAGSDYQVRIQSHNVLGVSEPSPAAEFATLAHDSCPAECSGVGLCHSDGTCECPEGRAGADCSLPTASACFGGRSFCLAWAFDGDDVHMRLAARTSGWLGLILAPSDGGMAGGDAITGHVEAAGSLQVVVADRWSSAYAPPGEDTELGGTDDLRNVHGFRNATHSVIAFTRARDTGDVHDAVIRPSEMQVSWAFAENGAQLFQYHGGNRGSAIVDLSAGTISEARDLVLAAHGALMLVAWGLCAPAGYALAHTAQVRARVTTGFFRNPGNARAFRGHRLCQSAAVALTLAGAVVVLSGGRRGFDSGHSIGGIAVLALCLVQGGLGFLFHSDTSHRLHRRVGSALMLFALLVQVPVGLSLVAWGEGAVIAWLAAVALYAVGLAAVRVRAQAHEFGLYLTAAADVFKAPLADDEDGQRGSTARAAEQHLGQQKRNGGGGGGGGGKLRQWASEHAAEHSRKGAWVRFSLGLDRVVRSRFWSLGGYVSRNRGSVVVACTLAALVCGAGLSQLVTETRIDKAWVPQTTRSISRLRSLEQLFPDMLESYAWLIVEGVEPGDNVLTRDVLLDVFRLQRYLETMPVEVERHVRAPATQTPAADGDGDASGADADAEAATDSVTVVSLVDVCAMWYGASGCRIDSPLDFWGNSAHTLGADDDLGRTVMQPGTQNAIGTPTDRAKVLGGVTLSDDSDGARAVHVSALRIKYHLRYNDARADAWQRAAKAAVFEWPHDKYRLHIETLVSWDDELELAIAGDTNLFVASLMTMMAFAAFALGRPHPTESRLLLGTGAVVSILLAILMSFGVCAAAGLFWGNAHSLLPTVIIAVGLDDAFIIVNGVPRVHHHRHQQHHQQHQRPYHRRGGGDVRSTHELVASVLSHAGSAVCTTSLTSCAAFLMGSVSTIPSVRSFCLYAALAILADLGMQVTFFVACLSYDIDRQRAGRWDCVPCVRANGATVAATAMAPGSSPVTAAALLDGSVPVATPFGPGTVSSVRASEGVTVVRLPWATAILQTASVAPGPTRLGLATLAAPGPVATRPGVNGAVDAPASSEPWHDDSQVAASSELPETDAAGVAKPVHSARLLRWYLAFLSRPVLRWVSFAAFAGLLAVGVLGLPHLEQGMREVDVVRDDSHIIAWREALNEHWADFEETLIVVTDAFDVADLDRQAAFLDLHDAVAASTTAEVQSWYLDFLAFARGEYEDLLVSVPVLAQPSDSQPAEEAGHASHVGFSRLVPPPEHFWALFREFITTPILGSAHARSLVFDRSLDLCLRTQQWACTIVASAFYSEYPFRHNSAARRDEMNHYRGIADSSPLPADVFNTWHPSLELDELMVGQLLQTMCLAVAAVTVVGGVFLPHPQPMLIAFLSLVALDVEIVGMMAHAGVTLSPISLVFLILSIGLSWDVQGHIVHAYLNGTGGRVHRTALALATVGPAVLRGASSTLLGLLFISSAASTIFRTMFFLFVMIIGLSCAHGFILVPAVLATVGTATEGLTHDAAPLLPPAVNGGRDTGEGSMRTRTVTVRPPGASRYSHGGLQLPSAAAAYLGREHAVVHGAAAVTVAEARSPKVSPYPAEAMTHSSTTGSRPASVSPRQSTPASTSTSNGAAASTAAAMSSDVSPAGAKRLCEAVYAGVAAILVAALIGVSLVSSGVVGAADLRFPQSSGALATHRATELLEDFVFDARMSGFAVPALETTYTCVGLHFPLDMRRHAVAFDWIYDTDLPPGAPDGYNPVHHSMIFSCTEVQPLAPFECVTMPPQCRTIMFGGGVGMGAYSFPPDVGLAVGKATDAIWFVLQMHYDNPARLPGIVDSSGIRINITSTLRPHDMAIVTTGVRIPLLRVPGRSTRAEVRAHCPPRATPDCPYCDAGFLDALLDGGPIALFGYAVHAHRLGREIWVEHFAANGTSLGTIAEDRYYNFETQRLVTMAPAVVVRPGERLETHCAFDTSDVAEVTVGGDGSSNEMCLVAFMYHTKTAAHVANPGLGFCLSDFEPVPST